MVWMWKWNTDNFAVIMTFNGHASRVTCGDFTPDGSNLSSYWAI